MKKIYNWKSLFAAVAIILIGIVVCVKGAISANPWYTILLSIGCSLIASGLVILMHDFFVERNQVSELDEWKISKIYSTRAEKNAESDPELVNAKYCLDAVAFGLSSFRSKHTAKVDTILRKGINIRMITMNPKSEFVLIRDREEEKNEGYTGDSIERLVKWADDLNQRNYKGKIVIKGYSSMTLDFYWRVDDTLYVGPYWYGVDSQQTITYKFVYGGKGFTQYTEYFENLWDNSNLCISLTNVTEVERVKRKGE